MVSRVWAINSVLAIALVICMSNVWAVWHTSSQGFPDKRSAVNEKKPMQIKKFPGNVVLKESDYQNVVEKNLFSPDRVPAPMETELPESEVREDVRISGEKVVLYGVIIVDDYKKALINNPGGAKTGSKIQWVSECDQIDNLKVQRILADEILLVDGSDRYRVLLNDPSKTVKNSKKSSARRVKSAQSQIISRAETTRTTEQKTGIPIEKVSKPTEKITISADGQYEIIDTPLGKIKRKRR